MNILTNLRVAVRLPAVAAISLAGLIAFAIVALSTVSTIRIGGERHHQITQTRVFSSNFSSAALTAEETGKTAHELLMYVMIGDATSAAATAEELRSDIDRFEQAHAEWEAMLTIPAEIAVRERIYESGHEVNLILTDRFLPAYERGDADAMIATLEPLDEAVVAHEAEGHAALAELTDDLQQADEQANELATSRMTLLWTVLLLTLAVVGVLAFVVTRSVLRPLGALKENLVKISSGDSDRDGDVQLDADRRDEFGEIATAFNAFADQLASDAAVARENARLAEHRAEEVATAATVAAENMNTVAVATTELSAAASEIARSTSEVSATAQAAVHAADRANSLMGRLAESSTQIGNVVESIRGIAAQTTMLALNATIEAARAGEAGRGFAVVASEVKDLAAETGTATADIVERVEAIRADTEAAVAALSEVSEVIADINAAQNVIAASVEEQAATTSEIDRSLTEAVTAVNQLAGTPSAARTDASFAAAA